MEGDLHLRPSHQIDCNSLNFCLGKLRQNQALIQTVGCGNLEDDDDDLYRD